ncbi:hypothetical protein GGQ92_001238 [Gracilibacillus halotolerans]|uniref:Uncharacterized protein n=1 Tax=Gracilibacillus halotolerans TaxID=74386 RepID=A0A841RMR4_9BACI|nr:hypothetical protein [Gracilibacillus halotolerans]MBB6512455.1 hypothetical protein [Gracilibacillus halotolerans]
MREVWYVIYVIILGLLAFYTGEIVTFIMLGIVLLALQNILKVLKEILHELRTERIE